MNENCTVGATEYPYNIIPCNVWKKKVNDLDYGEKQQQLKRPKYFCIEHLKRQCPKNKKTDNKGQRTIKSTYNILINNT